MLILKFLERLFKKKKAGVKVEVSNLTNSEANVFVVASEDLPKMVNLSSLFNNNPYSDLIIENSNRGNDMPLVVLSKNISNRKDAIDEILKKWDNNVWLSIFGGYDTGKSQLSLLIINSLKLQSLEYNFKDLSQDQFKNAIILVFKRILSLNLDSEQIRIIFFDDLPQLGFDDKINNLFVQLLAYCRANNIKILSTSNYRISSKITEKSNDDFVEIQIPLLTKKEIEEVISTYNDSDLAKKYSTIIDTISLGYPLYVQIICKYLESKNWILPEEELTSFISGKAFNELDVETYQKLLYTTQDDSAREMLYRLNLIMGTINNEKIELISTANPQVAFPFEKINGLIGTWLQKNNDETYFVSPLIRRLGSKDILPNTQKEINISLAKNILKNKNISQYDAQSALTYFLAGESYDDAGLVMVMALQSSLNQLEFFTQTTFGAIWLNTQLPEQMDSIIKLSIRVLQLNILNELQVKKNPRFEANNKFFVREDLLKHLKNGFEYPKEFVEMANLTLFNSYVQDDVIKALNYLLELKEVGFEMPPDENEKDILDKIWLLFDKINKKEEIEKWFECFDNIGKVESDFDNERMHLFSRRLFDNILENNEDLNEVIELLDYIENEARKNNLEILGAYSVKNKIVIISENLNDLNRAEDYFANVVNRFSKPHSLFLIKDEIGRQQYYKGFSDKGLSTLLEIEDVDISIITKVDTFLTIAKIFGEKDNNLANIYTKKALDYAQNLKISKLTLAKLIAEYAVSFWLLQDSKSAIYQLSESYELLLSSYKEIDEFENVNDYNVTVLRIGVALNYIFHSLKYGKPPEGAQHPTPRRGTFNSSYDSKVLEDWYYEEKKYMNAYLFIHGFEFFEDKEYSIKWANYAFDLNENIVLYTFKGSLKSFIVYQILQNKYQETLKVENEVGEYLESINIEMADEIKNSQQKESFLNLIEAKPPSTEGSDDYYLTFNLIPIILNEFTMVLDNKKSKEKAVEDIKLYLVTNKSIIKDDETRKAIFNILDNYPKGSTDSKQLLEWVSKLENENQKPIQIIYYLFCSLVTPSHISLKLQLNMMPYLEKVFKGLSYGSYLFLLYPFLYKFWTYRVLTTPQDFHFLDMWQENLKNNKDVKSEFKVVAMCVLMCMHLSYRPNDTEQDWMQDYIDFMMRSN